jgi:ribosome biogenesis GTPase
LLNKSDRVSDVALHRSIVNEHAPGVDVLATSAAEGTGIEALESRLNFGRTTALIGPSGAGKSSLINVLTKEVNQRTMAVRESDGRGRHTTSGGVLVTTPSGALLVDTPGLREIGIWQSDTFESGFSDVIAIASGCRFRDCRHDREPGCEIRRALEQGQLSSERFLRYLELERERNASRQRVLNKGRRR